ncbi:MAG: sigma 54-interacting transcriptional regulator [Planctomycetales bacterium]|nr:sigma 54-interacting transcriptional regulator [Planctomycetales bacterium]
MGSTPSAIDSVERTRDDRSPFASAWAVAQEIVHQRPDLGAAEAVVARGLRDSPEGSAAYGATIARTRHSVFYHQLQQLYAFGQQLVPPAFGPKLCFEAGRRFMGAYLTEGLYDVLQLALAKPGDFRMRFAEAVQQKIVLTAGEKYATDVLFGPEEIRFGLAYRDPQAMASYLAGYGLEVEACFQNSLDIIAGALDALAERLVAGYAPHRARAIREGLRGAIHLPIGPAPEFSYPALIATLLGYITQIKVRAEDAEAAQRFESNLILTSPRMRETWEKLRRASRTHEIVLLRGESGTGKSHVAKRIHELSPRRDRPLVEVGLASDIGSDNMIQSDLFGHEKGAFTGASERKQGLFSLADGGTIFLDEIGDASPELQAKLLRVLETGRFRRLGGTQDTQVDVRIVMATHRNLEQLVSAGKFRQDLYYRVNVIPVLLPPLRERREDVASLAEYLLGRHARASGLPTHRLAPGLAASLAQYDWPGNIRELDHALRHAAAMSEREEITVDDLPRDIRLALARKGTPPSPASEGSGAPEADGASPEEGPVIDVARLRSQIRRTKPEHVARPPECPAHVDYARRTWLAALIAEFGGDFDRIAPFWDRSAPKTLRKLVRALGLTEELIAARARVRLTGKGSS